jgi:hypothetical protein
MPVYTYSSVCTCTLKQFGRPVFISVYIYHFPLPPRPRPVARSTCIQLQLCLMLPVPPLPPFPPVTTQFYIYLPVKKDAACETSSYNISIFPRNSVLTIIKGKYVIPVYIYDFFSLGLQCCRGFIKYVLKKQN